MNQREFRQKFAAWKKEFYPIPASRVKRENAVDHSLQKWIGFEKKNLKKYGLTVQDFFDNEDVFKVDQYTCALCVQYVNNGCVDCPLFIVRDGIQCDNDKFSEIRSPYSAFVDKSNPRPMIAWLKKAKKLFDKKK